jgi:rod shape-determining protein MreC
VPLAWTAAVAFIVAAVVAVTLLANDRRETFSGAVSTEFREINDTVLGPVGEVLGAPVRWIGNTFSFIGSYWNAAGENRRLKDELDEMRRWRDIAAALEDRNERLEAVLSLKTEPPIPMAAARIVADARGPFANSRLANAGSADGVEVGNPVMNERGLVGRVVGVTPGVSRVLLLTDVVSRTPVMVDRTNARAILTGDGGGNPRLEYLRGREPVKEGDRVLTSGDGGVFPRGLPVGTAVKGLDGNWRVALDADSGAIDFVRILKFRDFSQLADQQALSITALPPVTTPDPRAAAEAAAQDAAASVQQRQAGAAQ